MIGVSNRGRMKSDCVCVTQTHTCMHVCIMYMCICMYIIIANIFVFIYFKRLSLMLDVASQEGRRYFTGLIFFSLTKCNKVTMGRIGFSREMTNSCVV